MASITIEVGSLTATINTTDAKANAVVTQYAAAIGATGTNQQKLNTVVQALVRHMQDQGRGHRAVTAQAEAMAAAQVEIDALKWE